MGPVLKQAPQQGQAPCGKHGNDDGAGCITLPYPTLPHPTLAAPPGRPASAQRDRAMVKALHQCAPCSRCLWNAQEKRCWVRLAVVKERRLP